MVPPPRCDWSRTSRRPYAGTSSFPPPILRHIMPRRSTARSSRPTAASRCKARPTSTASSSPHPARRPPPATAACVSTVRPSRSPRRETSPSWVSLAAATARASRPSVVTISSSGAPKVTSSSTASAVRSGIRVLSILPTAPDWMAPRSPPWSATSRSPAPASVVGAGFTSASRSPPWIRSSLRPAAAASRSTAARSKGPCSITASIPSRPRPSGLGVRSFCTARAPRSASPIGGRARRLSARTASTCVPRCAVTPTA